MSEALSIDVHLVARRVIMLRLRGALDTNGVEAFRSARHRLHTELSAGWANVFAIVVDMRGVHTLDEHGAAQLSAVALEARGIGARFVLVAGTPAVEDVLLRTGLRGPDGGPEAELRSLLGESDDAQPP